ncbi:hypothetical protein DERP_002926 [Dermatophagoides pteronyssinus]|uniref:Uncharacterized protein n=1 Tax=Dermatophagoides pteronyssinus TaxID=6956 RepID=A0ABQ8JW46_DERPT|nr:hypothetical protein DERP_002926 [Dermatophagoides pteronyssinus]
MINGRNSVSILIISSTKLPFLERYVKITDKKLLKYFDGDHYKNEISNPNSHGWFEIKAKND